MKELRLLKNRKKGLVSIIFSRTGIVLLLFALTIAIFIFVEIFFAEWFEEFFGGVGIINLIMVIAIINSDMDSSAKLTWTLVIVTTSIFGALFYLYTKIDIGNGTIKKGYIDILERHRYDLEQSDATLRKLEKDSKPTVELVNYLGRSGTFPVTDSNEVKYYPLGEYKWKDMLEELEKAEDFIFMEYFIIEEGKMWGSILNTLKEKADKGVEVRILYDGLCAISKLPYNYPNMIRELGIQCKMFSPIRPFFSTHYNYRDHRKIIVIDGKVGFMGGVNLADEYINETHPFGHWKDTAIRIKGEGVRKLTLLFLNMWSMGEKNPEYDYYLDAPAPVFPKEKGYIVPYGDNPFDDDKVGEKVYMDILNRADSYVHIMTPYLILDDELLMAIKYAAERGVDVRIILPGIPDKYPVYALAKTYFRTLLDSGVKIYTYTPGFVHAKIFVSDDIKAVVGTINLDYRSLYHHFECGTYMYDVACISDIERDYRNTLKKCHRVTYRTIKEEKIITKIVGTVTRLIAPLL